MLRENEVFCHRESCRMEGGKKMCMRCEGRALAVGDDLATTVRVMSCPWSQEWLIEEYAMKWHNWRVGQHYPKPANQTAHWLEQSLGVFAVHYNRSMKKHLPNG